MSFRSKAVIATPDEQEVLCRSMWVGAGCLWRLTKHNAAWAAEYQELKADSLPMRNTVPL